MPGHDVRIVEPCSIDDRSDLSSPSQSPPTQRDPDFRTGKKSMSDQTKQKADQASVDDFDQHVRFYLHFSLAVTVFCSRRKNDFKDPETAIASISFLKDEIQT